MFTEYCLCKSERIFTTFLRTHETTHISGFLLRMVSNEKNYASLKQEWQWILSREWRAIKAAKEVVKLGSFLKGTKTCQATSKVAWPAEGSMV